MLILIHLTLKCYDIYKKSRIIITVTTTTAIRHDKVGKKIHRLLSKKYNLEFTDKWYQHSPEPVAENEEVKILWDFMIQTDRVIEHRRPDIVVVEKIGGNVSSSILRFPVIIMLDRKNWKRKQSMKISELR